VFLFFKIRWRSENYSVNFEYLLQLKNYRYAQQSQRHYLFPSWNLYPIDKLVLQPFYTAADRALYFLADLPDMGIATGASCA
jgi:hypothetical protein